MGRREAAIAARSPLRQGRGSPIGAFPAGPRAPSGGFVNRAASRSERKSTTGKMIPTGPFESVAAAAKAPPAAASTIVRRPGALAALSQQRAAEVVNAVSVMSIEHQAARRKNWLVVARSA